MNLLTHLKKIDWIIVIAIFGLSFMGLISIYSSSLVTQDFSAFYKQITFLIIAFLIMLFVSFFDYRKLRENSNLILIFYMLCMALLVGVLFMPSIRGISSWYQIGVFNFGPIEPTKLALILLLSVFLAKRHNQIYDFKNIIFSGFYAMLPCILVFPQPDFGSIIIFLSIWILMLIISGIRKKHLIALAFIFATLFAFAFTFLMADYQKARITDFLSDEADLLDADWNKDQARIAIGSGGLLGKGIGNGSQAQYGFLPIPKSDFIFSAIAEETGFIGVVILASLYFLIFYRILKISILSKSNFARLFLAGWAISIFVQMFINVFMNLGVLPVVGLPLPFVSYGGSNLIFNFIALGILQNIKIIET